MRRNQAIPFFSTFDTVKDGRAVAQSERPPLACTTYLGSSLEIRPGQPRIPTLSVWRTSTGNIG